MNRLRCSLVLLAFTLTVPAQTSELAVTGQEGTAETKKPAEVLPAPPKAKAKKRTRPPVHVRGVFGDLSRESQPARSLRLRQPANPAEDTRNLSLEPGTDRPQGWKLLTLEF
jgi:hypothetical protein